MKFLYLTSRRIFAVAALAAAAAILFFGFSEKDVPADSEAEAVKVPIIMYHSVLKDSTKSGKYVITVPQLEADIKYISENGYTSIFITDLIDYVQRGTPLPEKPIILTFDDGHFNNETYLLPLLEVYDCRAVISIVGEYTDRYTEQPDENPNYAYLSWGNVRDVLASGRIEIENHSYSMHSAGARLGAGRKRGESDEAYRRALTEDLGKMQRLCTEQLGYAPPVFTYPFGSIGKTSVDILHDMGFSASLSCNEGFNYIGRNSSLHLLKRCIRTNTRSVADILNTEG